MATTVSLLTQAFTYSPINAECWYQLNSGSSSLNNFQYYYDVYTYDPGTFALSQDLGVYFIPPRPNTGDGVFSPHKALKTQLSNRYPLSYNIGLTYCTAFTQSAVVYNIDYGLQYSPINLTFSTFDFLGFLGLDFAYSGFDVIPGDVVTIQMSNLGLNPQYNTTASVALSGATASVVLLPYGTSPNAFEEVGSITQISRLVATGSSLRWGFNGTRQYDQRYDTFNEYVIQTGTSSPHIVTNFLTPYTQSFTASNGQIKEIYLNQNEIQGILINRTNIANAPELFINTYDSNFNFIANYGAASFNLGFTASNYRYWAVPTGTQNLVDMGIPLTGVTYYEVILAVHIFPSDITQSYILRKIVTQCTPYKNVRLMFSNSLGGWEFFNFNLDSKQTRNVERAMYRKILPWNYQIGNRQDTVLAQKVQDSYIINSNWLSQYNYEFLNELLQSTDVYVVDGSSNNIYPIIITDTSWEYKTYLRDQLFNAVINYTVAYDINSVSE